MSELRRMPHRSRLRARVGGSGGRNGMSARLPKRSNKRARQWEEARRRALGGHQSRFEPPQTRRFPFTILFILLIFLAGAAAAAWWWSSTQQPVAEDEAPVAEEAPLTEDISTAGFDFVVDKEERNILHLKSPFVVNLSGADGRWVMVVRIWFEADTLAVARELNDNPAKFHRITDDITRTLSAWTYAELAYGSGMDRLKNQIRERVNQYLEKGNITAVLFNEVYFSEQLPKANPPR
jgi:flagellar basal body-associated protein FliL